MPCSVQALVLKKSGGEKPELRTAPPTSIRSGSWIFAVNLGTSTSPAAESCGDCSPRASLEVGETLGKSVWLWVKQLDASLIIFIFFFFTGWIFFGKCEICWSWSILQMFLREGRSLTQLVTLPECAWRRQGSFFQSNILLRSFKNTMRRNSGTVVKFCGLFC